jgi:hypothetical protein
MQEKCFVRTYLVLKSQFKNMNTFRKQWFQVFKERYFLGRKFYAA